jgi:DNA-binding LytR/AlgR family response regulator
MAKIKILVVEDEILIADNMCDTLNELGYETLEPAMNYTEAIATISEELPDIAILDIHLSGRRNGIDVAKKIKEEYNFPFIFLTSFSDTETVTEAKKYEPSAFLVKPFSKEELFTSIEIAISNFSSNMNSPSEENLIIKESLFVKEKGVFIKLNFDDILFIKSDHVYLELTMKDTRKLLIRGSLNDVITKLNDNFLRVHRSYIVNTHYLDQIDTSFVKIHHNSIPIGKKYRHSLLEKLNII